MKNLYIYITLKKNNYFILIKYLYIHKLITGKQKQNNKISKIVNLKLNLFQIKLIFSCLTTYKNIKKIYIQVKGNYIYKYIILKYIILNVIKLVYVETLYFKIYINTSKYLKLKKLKKI